MKKNKRFLFYTSSNISLAKKVIKISRMQTGRVDIKRFADQEICVLVKEDVKGKIIYVLGSTFPPSDNCLELLILIHTLKANGAKKVYLIIPYFGYAKADHIAFPGSSVAGNLMVRLTEESGADKIISVDIHSKRVEKFFKKPLIHLSAIPLLASYFKKKKNVVVVSPDLGGVKRAILFAKNIGLDNIVVIKKYRPAFDQVKIEKILGDVSGKDVIIVDDMIQSGGTVIKAARALKKKGARDIYVAVSHLVFTGPGVSLLERDKNIKQVVFTDTTISFEKLSGKFKKISVADLISSAL